MSNIVTHITDQDQPIFATGYQIISGVKEFATRPTVSGEVVLVSGDPITTRLIQYNNDTFEASANDIEGYFVAKTLNYSDGHIGIEFYHPDGTRLGYSILGNRYGDGFVQSLSSTFRIEKIFGDLAYLQSAGLKDELGRIFNLPSQEGTLALLSDLNNISGNLPSGLDLFNLVYTTGDQSITGSKFFLSNIEVSGTGIFNNLVINNLTELILQGITGIDFDNVSGFELNDFKFKLINCELDFSGKRPTINGSGILLIGDIQSLPNTIVYTTGVQTISGLKNFDISPTVNNVKVLVSGEAYPNNNPSGFINILPDTVVTTTGDQYISGRKSFYADRYIFSGANVLFIDNTGISNGNWEFANRPTVNGTGVLLIGELSTAIGATGATGPAGVDGATGATGPAGVDGATGATGATGPAGEKWLTGSGFPTNVIAAQGDLYLDTDSGNIYEQVSFPSGITWTLKGNIKGATGAVGATGITQNALSIELCDRINILFQDSGYVPGVGGFFPLGSAFGNTPYGMAGSSLMGSPWYWFNPFRILKNSGSYRITMIVRVNGSFNDSVHCKLRWHDGTTETDVPGLSDFGGGVGNPDRIFWASSNDLSPVDTWYYFRPQFASYNGGNGATIQDVYLLIYTLI